MTEELRTKVEAIIEKRKPLLERLNDPTMQAKDIPDLPVLEFLAHVGDTGYRWAIIFSEAENSVQHAMPEWVNEKLARAKMKALIRRGLADGCNCGCRGDYTLTAKGREYLNTPRSADANNP